MFAYIHILCSLDRWYPTSSHFSVPAGSSTTFWCTLLFAVPRGSRLASSDLVTFVTCTQNGWLMFLNSYLLLGYSADAAMCCLQVRKINLRTHWQLKRHLRKQEFFSQAVLLQRKLNIKSKEGTGLSCGKQKNRKIKITKVSVLTWRRLCLYDRHIRNPETSDQQQQHVSPPLPTLSLSSQKKNIWTFTELNAEFLLI